MRVCELSLERSLQAGTGETLDEVLLVALDAGSGEIHLHGSPAVVERVRAGLGDGSGSAVTASGLEQQALEDLEQASSECGARVLLDQARGTLRRTLVRLARATPARRARGCAALHERARIASALLEPRRLLLAGPPNAGKSTLFNLLVGEQRAIVSPTPGTTRDLIEGDARLGPWPVSVVDSAGLSELGRVDSGASLDAAAQLRARRELANVDLVLWCDPRGAGPPPELGSARCVVLLTRADEREPEFAGTAEFEVSVLEAPELALARIEQAYCRAFRLPRLPYRSAAAVPFRAEQLLWLRELAAGFDSAAERACWLNRLGPPSEVEGPAGLL
jgi:hypothetical protein